jgi:AraC family transcriptional regulator of adaptative response/methylated-DNA-[protein]-cysteine methyltransferase
VPINVLLKGTNFQIKVWESLLRIPFGKVVSYTAIADLLGRPRAVRAVANAVASNPVPFLVPCHRVIRKIGEVRRLPGRDSAKEGVDWLGSYEACTGRMKVLAVPGNQAPGPRVSPSSR